ncbi:MAG: hypothetical protein D6772_02180 [Bacteroidetes bacterium]|nr:MAG: hypothetical protein D6772_02180 [Bacteroidota bacterium]
MQYPILYSVFGLALLVSSCGPTLSPFTQQLYDEYRWSEDELKRIQFYLSDDVVLYRELQNGKSEIVEGEIKVVDGRRRDQITFRRGTPGVLLFSPKQNRFAISFEDGGKDRYLMFGPSPKVGNRYVLLAGDWNRQRGSLTYAGQKWFVNADDGFATLMVDLRRLQQTQVNTRIARGRRVGE